MSIEFGRWGNRQHDFDPRYEENDATPP